MTRQQLCECIATESKVIVDGIEYMPMKYILSFKDKKWKHSAELKDLKSKSSVVIAPIERITKK